MKRIIGHVVNGKFLDSRPKEINNREHGMHREYVRNRGREEYARDIIQPYRDGEINPEFIEAYGKQEAIKRGVQPSEIE